MNIYVQIKASSKRQRETEKERKNKKRQEYLSDGLVSFAWHIWLPFILCYSTSKQKAYLSFSALPLQSDRQAFNTVSRENREGVTLNQIG